MIRGAFSEGITRDEQTDDGGAMTAGDPWDGDDGDELEAEIMRAEGFRSGGVPLRLRVGRGGVGWALVNGWWCGKRPLVAANARLLSRLGTALPPLPSPYRRG